MTTVITFGELPGLGIRFCRVHLQRLENAGQFPRRIHLSQRRIGWLRSEIEAWITARADARDAA
ncbi:MAG: AlpA family phage regulatory protein [Xanthobacteraceae bacterium]